jgi:DNA-binding transcriptional ArsR family regulator
VEEKHRRAVAASCHAKLDPVALDPLGREAIHQESAFPYGRPGKHVTIRSPILSSMDEVFRALADPTRRGLLDRLYERDGQTLSELESELPMTRFGVMKHLRVLEEANLVTTRRRGREKLHFLNPVPIRLVHDRWVSKYAEPWAAALSELKQDLEEEE